MTTQASIRPLFLAACILLVLCSPFLGMSLIHPSALLSPGSPDAEVFWRLRLPRTVAAFLAGSGLAMSGMAFGASLYFRFGAACSVLGAAGGLSSALLGGLLSMLLVYLITRSRGGFSTPVMLLAGVIINFFFSSLVMFIQYWSDAHDAQRIMRWLMGSLTGVEPARIADLAFIVMAALLLIRAMTSELDLLTAGEELAASRGVAVRQTKVAAFAVSSVMVGAIVSVTGPIGFVGMMAPHLCRLWFGWSHRILLPNAFMLGGCFLVVCDLVSRSILAPAELPIGIITAMVGGPFFLWTLFRSNSSGELL